MDLKGFGLTKSQMLWRGLQAFLFLVFMSALSPTVKPAYYVLVWLFVCFGTFKLIQYEEWGKAGWEKTKAKVKKVEKSRNVAEVPQREYTLPPLSSLPPEKIMTYAEAREYLAMGKSTGYNDTEKMKLDGFFKDGWKWKIQVKDLILLIEKKKPRQ